MSSFEIVKNLHFVPRKDWGPKDLPRLGHSVDRSIRNHVIIHHTVSSDDSDNSPYIWESRDKIEENMRHLQTVRTKELGADVPYNFVAYLLNSDQLVICEGRGEDRSGAHTKGHNTRGIAVSFAGNFHEDSVETEEVASRMPLLSLFLGWLKFSASHPDYGDFTPMKNLGSLTPAGRNVFFHRDFKATACPGNTLAELAAQVDFLKPN